MHYKKELALALQEIKKSNWFAELEKQDQEHCIEMQKAYFTPPNFMQNTLLNACMVQLNIMDAWLRRCANNFPWANPYLSGGEVSLEKVRFFNENI